MANNEFQCRICAKVNSEEPQNIFEQPDGKLLRHIEQLTGIMLKNSNNLPQHICLECLMDLREARAFRRRCIKSQIYFTTIEYKRATRRECDEENQQRNVNIKSVQTEQDNVVGTTTTTTTDNQYDQSMEAAISELLHDEESAIFYDSDALLSEENSIISDVETDVVAVGPTADYETVEFEVTKCEEGTSKAASSCSIQSNDHDKLKKAKITDYNKSAQKEPKKRGITEYVCEQCGNCYDNVNHFRTHLNRHAGIKPFPCLSCPSKFYTKSELKLHSITHTGERPFKCRHCSSCYSYYGAKLLHERSHTNERPYKCTYCPKDFTTLRNLKDHLLTHTKERKFGCVVCDKNFQRRSHLVTHNRSQLHKENVMKLENLNDV